MQPKSIILFFYGYILFFRRQLGGNLQIKTGMILLSFAKRLNNSLLREKNLTFKQESKLASLKKNAKSLKNFTLDFLS